MRSALLLALCLLGACTPRAGIETGTPAAGATLVPVLVATTRAADPETAGLVSVGALPGTDRSEVPGFGRYEVAIPPTHLPGTIRRAQGGRAADPRRDFLLTGADTLDAAGFRREIAAQLARQPRGNREVTIFVHGFNTTFIEGVYRVAQLGHDLQIPGVLAHYAWPSRGAPLAYVHDRDSALFARDGLETMIRAAEEAGASRVVLIGHSMGTHLVMETLRQMAPSIRSGRSRIGGVVLIAPDLDVDLFRMQARRIGPLPQPFVIFTSHRDRVLGLSARLTGEADRLGNITDPERLADLDVTLLDITAFGTGSGHFTLGESPSLIRLFSQIDAVDSAFSGDPSGAIPLVPGVLLTVQNTTQMILRPLSDLGSSRELALPQAAPRDPASP